MNYKVILDESKLRQFIDWLPGLNQNETYYVCLFARNKYCKDVKHISSDKQQLKRFTSSKEGLYHKISQLEIPTGRYIQTRNGEVTEIPQEALALYISPNPRSMVKASYESIKHLVNCLQTHNKGFNPHQEVLSCIQQAEGTRVFKDFDYDGVTVEELVPQLEGVINPEAYSLLVTRGGVHCLVKPSMVHPQYSKSWYLAMTRIPGHDKNAGPGLIPVPGTHQGGFCPYLL